MKLLYISLLSAGIMLTACAKTDKDNPLLSEWNTPYQIPPSKLNTLLTAA